MRKKTYIRPLGVLLSELIYQEVCEVTNREEISVSEFIRNAIESRLAEIRRKKPPQTERSQK